MTPPSDAPSESDGGRTGAYGDVAFAAATIDDCAREQIRIPGAVQPHGAIVVLHNDVIVQATANLVELLALSDIEPTEVLGSTLAAVIGPAAAERVQTGDHPVDPRKPQWDRLELGGRSVDFCTFEADECVVVQLERTAETAVTPVTADPDFATLATSALSTIPYASSAPAIMDAACAVVAELTGFDRVMGYVFHPDDHGEVVAEVVRDDLEPFHGLHYPASDIPAQARELYLRHWLRAIPDARYEPVPLEPAINPVTNEPLDMAAISCRAVSLLHCEYLQNMGVRSSMSISLIVDGRLWGLIACHHRTPLLPSPSMRDACEFVGLATSAALSSRLGEERSRLDADRERALSTVARNLAETDDLVEGLLGHGVLQKLVDADGVAVAIGSRIETMGDTPPDAVISSLVARLAARHPREIVGVDRLGDLPEPDASAGDTSQTPVAPFEDLGAAAGLLALPLSSMQHNYVVWFRARWPHTVRWGGNPDKAVVQDPDGSSRLRPRASFDEWVETVQDRSRPWTQMQLETVHRLRDVIARHVSRTVDQLGRLNDELARSNEELDAFAYVVAHDLREPLRGIVNHARSLAAEYDDVLDDAGRRRLTGVTDLAVRMNGLLSNLFDYARFGRTDLVREPLPVAAIVDDVRDLLHTTLRAAGAELVDRSGDASISGDQDLLAQVFMNLVTNAVKYNVSSPPVVEIGVTSLGHTSRGRQVVRQSAIAERDDTVYFVQDNGIGIPPDKHEEIFQVFRRLHGPDDFGGGGGAGLAIVRRIVERHGGTVWVESDGKSGTTFFFTVAESMP